MEYLERYFRLFDETRTSEEAKEELMSLFTDDVVFVLNGYTQSRKDKFRAFVTSVYENLIDLKHMYEGWKLNEETGRYETNWAICGKRKDQTIYTQTGVDIVELDENGKIKYIENIPKDSNMFSDYKN